MTSTPSTCSKEQLTAATHWCIRLSEASFVADEGADLQSWLDAEPGNRAAFDAVLATWRSVEAYAVMPETIRMRRAALAAGPRVQRWRAARLFLRPSRSGAVAATLVVALIAAGLWLAHRPSTISTDIGERRVVTLPDGSRVSLDAATRLTVSFTKDRRRLRLVSGRAKFDVARSVLRPFSVEAGGRTVVATGTSFSVEVLKRQVRVILYEGHVTVTDQARPSVPPRVIHTRPAASGQEFEMAAGRVLVADEGRPPVEQLNPDPARSLSWEGGLVAFDDEPLGSAVERINRYSERKIQVVDPAAATLRISGLFDAGNVEAFVDGVTGALPLHAVRLESGIELRRAAARDERKPAL